MSDRKPGVDAAGAVDRRHHPGTITFVTKFDGKRETKPISEFPDTFIFVDGVPVVREELYTWDKEGTPCPPAAAASGKVMRFGPSGELLQSVTMGPRRPGGR